MTIDQNDPTQADADPWMNCMMTGTLVECTGMDRACETIERRLDEKVHFVAMGCKQRSSCMNMVP